MRRILIVLSAVIFLGLMGFLIFSQRGLLNLHKLRSDRQKLEEEAGQLRQENESLRKKAGLLAGDLNYLEKLARQKLGMVRPDEVIIKIPETVSTDHQQQEKGKEPLGEEKSK
jgi:cell division protein FtsB